MSHEVQKDIHLIHTHYKSNLNVEIKFLVECPIKFTLTISCKSPANEFEL